MKKNNKKGFTLVELVIVVAVMAILVAVAIPTVSSITSKAQSATDKSNARTIESMIKLEQANQNATLENGDIEEALEKAALGIDSGKAFFYNTTTGAVTAGSDSTGDGVVITFGDDGEVTVGSGSGEDSE